MATDVRNDATSPTAILFQNAEQQNEGNS